MKEVFRSILIIIKERGDTLATYLQAYPQLKTLSTDCDGETPEEKAAVALIYLCRDEGEYNGFGVAVSGVLLYLGKKGYAFSYTTFPTKLRSLLDRDCSASDVEDLIREGTILNCPDTKGGAG